jgi:ribosomal protein S27E
MNEAHHTASEVDSISPAFEFSKESFESQKPLLIQPKLSVGAVDDPFEREADLMADRVMRMPDSSFIQRKCASCEEEEKIHRMPETSFLQRKCTACEHEEEEKIHRKVTPFIQKKDNGLEGGTASESVTNQINSSRGGGNRMSENTLSFMESRFNTDFSGVKIHTDSNAVQMSRELNAQAFTVGNDIYFNAGKYSPESDFGRHLLAHELTHTVQQGGAIERKVQRRVSPRISQLREHLSYGVFDWAITDGDVASVLLTLRELTSQDLQDTVGLLESEGLIGRLFENLQESDDRNLDMIPDFMQSVQNARFRRTRTDGTTEVSSCNPNQRSQNQNALSHVVEWANRSIDAIINFQIGIDPLESARIGRLLDRYFFHEAQTGVLTQAQRVNFGDQMIERLNVMKEGAPNTIINCVSPFDLLCAGNTIAYVESGLTPTMRMCSSFFGKDDNEKINTVFHELMHFYNGRVGDTGYAHERVFEFLPPDRAVNNADSYSTFATAIMLGERTALQTEERSVRDVVEGCSPLQEANLRRDIAYATRMIQNATNQIEADYDVQNRRDSASTNFHSTNHQDLVRFVERFNLVKNSIPRQIAFHCESGSSQTTDTLPFIEGDGLHLTLPYFNIVSENQRVDTLLAILFKKYSAGMTTPVWSFAPNYATQTLDQAYNNPGAFVGYMRAMFQVRGIWNFADAEIRNEEALTRTIDGIEESLDEAYYDEKFRDLISHRITPRFLAEFTATPITNRPELQTRTRSIQQRMPVIRLFLNRMYRDFSGQNTNNFIEGLLAFQGSIFSEVGLFSLTESLYSRFLRRLNTSFRPILTRINHDEAVRFEEWTDYDTILSEYRTESQHLLSIMRTYKSYLEQLHNLPEMYQNSRDVLQASPQVQNLDFDSFIDTVDNFSLNRTALLDEVSNIASSVIDAISEGRNFDRRNPDLPDLTRLLQRYQRQLRGLIPRNRR